MCWEICRFFAGWVWFFSRGLRNFGRLLPVDGGVLAGEADDDAFDVFFAWLILYDFWAFGAAS